VENRLANPMTLRCRRQAWELHGRGDGTEKRNSGPCSDGPRDDGGNQVAARPRARKKALEGAMMPLDNLLGIMRDNDQDSRSRLDAAKAAAPYCHARLSSTELSGPNGSAVQVHTTQKIDISDLSDEELDILERALRKTIAL
jgi:hypothetical protein